MLARSADDEADVSPAVFHEWTLETSSGTNTSAPPRRRPILPTNVGLVLSHAHPIRFVRVATFDISHETHGDLKIVVVRFAGQADKQSITNLIAQIAALGDDTTLARVLMDETDLRPGLLLPSDVRGIVERWRALIARRTVRIAVYAPSPMIYGLNRLAESVAGGDAKDRLAAFRSRTDAIGWLLRA